MSKEDKIKDILSSQGQLLRMYISLRLRSNFNIYKEYYNNIDYTYEITIGYKRNPTLLHVDIIFRDGIDYDINNRILFKVYKERNDQKKSYKAFYEIHETINCLKRYQDSILSR